MYIDLNVEPNTSFTHNIPKDYNAFIYTIEGEAIFGEDTKPIAAHTTIVLGGGDAIKVTTLDQSAHFVLIAGRPIKEPVVQYGPFVMNTQEEIMQAMRDYQLGKNGFERAVHWESAPVPLSD